MNIRISSTRSPQKYAQELAETAMISGFIDTCWSAKKKNSVSGPGQNDRGSLRPGKRSC
jgi:hypothetical protein